MEVADNLHQLDKVITDDMRVKTSPTMAQSIPTLKHVTVVPTCRSLKTPDLGDNNRANLIRDDSVINGIITTCKLYYKPDTQPTVDSVRKVLTDAYESTDENCGVEEAIEWAHDFEIPASTVASDMKNFRAAGLDFKVMVKRQLSLNATNRLSKERVDKLLPNDPEREKLFDLSNGMVIPHCPSFVPNSLGETTPPRYQP